MKLGRVYRSNYSAYLKPMVLLIQKKLIHYKRYSFINFQAVELFLKSLHALYLSKAQQWNCLRPPSYGIRFESQGQNLFTICDLIVIKKKMRPGLASI